MFGDLYGTLKDFAQFDVKFQVTQSVRATGAGKAGASGRGTLTAQATLAGDGKGGVTHQLGIVHNPGNAAHPAGYPLHASVLSALLRTSAALQQLVTVKGGTRTPGQNADVGGRPNSFHLERMGGVAADFEVESMSNPAVYDFLLEAGIFSGVLRYGGHVHGDLGTSVPALGAVRPFPTVVPFGDLRTRE